jgi:hypothetical protein
MANVSPAVGNKYFFDIELTSGESSGLTFQHYQSAELES